MKILIVTQYFWPEDFRINDLALGLRDAGHDVAVLTGMPNYPGGRDFPGYGMLRPWRESYHGISVYRAPLIRRGNAGNIRLFLNYLSFALSASIMGPLRLGRDFEVIFVYEPSPITVGIPARVLKAITGAPVMLWIQDLWPESLAASGALKARWILNSVEHLVRWVYRGCDRILVQSLAFAAPVAAMGVDPERIGYLPNSAEPLYQPLNLDRGAPENEELPRGFRVMFAGNVGAAQDFNTILDAAQWLRSHHDIHWVILGEGRMFDWVRVQVQKRGLERNFHLLGRRPVAAMPQYFALADAMLVTLKKEPIFSLTIPAKVQSYLACARPIVAALDGEGARVITEAGAGLVGPAEDPIALANAVLALYNMSDAERAAMGSNGRNYFEHHFEREMLLRRLEQWFTELKRA